MDKIVLQLHRNVFGEHDLEVLKWAYLNSYYQTGLKNLLDRAVLEHGDVHELLNVETRYKKIDEIYLLGAQSCIEPSWIDFEDTFETNVISTMKILEHVRVKSKKTKIFFASSSEVFGNPS